MLSVDRANVRFKFAAAPSSLDVGRGNQMAHGISCFCNKCTGKSKNRSNKSGQAKQQSAARVAKQRERGSAKFGDTNTHGDSQKGGGQNSTGKPRR